MKLERYSILGVKVPDLDAIVLSQAERKLLARASVLLEQIRDVRNARVPVDWYADDEDDSDLVFGWRICHDLAERGRISAEFAGE